MLAAHAHAMLLPSSLARTHALVLSEVGAHLGASEQHSNACVARLQSEGRCQARTCSPQSGISLQS